MSAKPKVAFFDFACCEGCQLQIANLEEDILGVLGLIDLVEFREVMTGKAPEYDIAFIEGSITRKVDEVRVKDIRNRSRIIVAYGQCAVSGGVNKLKNHYSDMMDVRKIVYKDKAAMEHLDTYPTRAVEEVIKVDVIIPGCPVDKDEILSVVKQIALGKTPAIPDYPVCVECKLKENICRYDEGETCLGPITRAGCGAICPSNGVPCDACRGTVSNPNKQAMHEVLAKYNLTVDEIIRKINIFAVDPEVSR